MKKEICDECFYKSKRKTKMLEIHAEHIYHLISGSTLLFLGIIWRKSNWLNAFIKLILISAGIWGELLFFMNT